MAKISQKTFSWKELEKKMIQKDQNQLLNIFRMKKLCNFQKMKEKMEEMTTQLDHYGMH